MRRKAWDRDKLMAAKRFYESSSGDTWDLKNEDGALFILHSPNEASGGSPTRYDLASFMARDAHVAEHLALVELIASLVEHAAAGEG